MRKIFISYANEVMAYSLKRIGRQARKLGIFDEVILYTPQNLPDYVKQGPLFEYSRGGGLWSWKPAIIKQTLEENKDAVVVYVDAGCTLRKSATWEMLFGLMERYNTICFQYAKEQPQWQKFGTSSPEMFHWTKKATMLFLDSYLGDSNYRTFRQIWGGLLIIKGNPNRLVEEWHNLVFTHPELLTDVKPEEYSDQQEGFIAHRHDQSLLTALVTKHEDVLILPEISERYTKDSFVYASRLRAKNLKEASVISAKHFLRRSLGDGLFTKIKKWF